MLMQPWLPCTTMYDESRSECLEGCRHGHLTPENVLVSADVSGPRGRSPGGLVITDLGLARLHSGRIRDRLPRSVGASGTQRFVPDLLSRRQS